MAGLKPIYGGLGLPLNSMKILCFIESLAVGGAEKTTVRLVDEWVAAGHEVHLALVRPILDFRPERPGVRLYGLDGERGSFLRSISAASQVAREVQPNVVVGHMPKGVLLAMVAQLAHPKAFLLGVEHSIPEQHYSGLKKVLVRLLMSRGYRRADGIVAVSQGAADNLVAWGVPAKKVHALGNPIPVQALYRSAKAGTSLRQRPELPGVAAVGRLVPLKGLDVLIKAVALLRDQGCPVELVILGEGPERANLEALVGQLNLGNLVSLPGMVSDPQATVISADLLACSSHYEGFGNVLVEAMAVGTGCVSTDCPTGPREIIREADRLAKPNNPEDLARVLKLQLDRLEAMSPRERADLKKALRAEAAHRFNADQVAWRYLDAALPDSLTVRS